MRRQWMAVRAIAEKDMRAVGNNVQVWLPMLMLPLLFGVFVPVMLLLALRAPQGIEVVERLSLADVGWEPAETFPVEATPEQAAAYFVFNFTFAPLFLLIPLMAASVTSAESFAGEKERGTLETLLFSPVSVPMLLVGKGLGAFLPTIGLTIATLLMSTIAINIAGWPLFGAVFFPNVNWLPLIGLVVPALTLAIVLINVFISARVATFQAAYQLGGVVVLPVVALLVSGLQGVLMLTLPAIFAIGVVLIVLNGVLLLVLRKNLDRMHLFESQVR